MRVVGVSHGARGRSGIDHLAATVVVAQALRQTSTVVQTALLPVQRAGPATDRSPALAALATSVAVAQSAEHAATATALAISIAVV